MMILHYKWGKTNHFREYIFTIKNIILHTAQTIINIIQLKFSIFNILFLI